MSRPTLQDAVEVLSERKRAMGAEVGGMMLTDLRPLLIGMDVNQPELEHFLAVFAHRTEQDIALGSGVFMAGAWFDGFVTGLKLAEMRRAYEQFEAE